MIYKKIIVALLLLAGTGIPADDNIIENGDFEKGFKGWSFKNNWKKEPAPGELERNIVYSGNYAYKLGGRDKETYLTKGFSLVNHNKPYLISFMLKTDNIGKDDFYVQLLTHAPKDGKLKPAGWLTVNRKSTFCETGGSTGWSKKTIYIPKGSIRPEVKRILIFFRRKNNSTGTVYLDDVKVKNPESQIENGGFENGFSRWSYEKYRKKNMPGAVQSQVVAEGSGAFKMHRDGDKDNSLYYPSIKVNADDRYQMSFKLKCEGLNKDDLTVKVLCRSPRKVLGWANLPPGSGVFTLYRAGGTFDWKDVKINLTAGSLRKGTTTITVFFHRKDNANGVAYIDCFDVTRVDTPQEAPPEKNQSLFQKGVNLIEGDSSFETSSCNWQGVRDKVSSIDGIFSLKLPAGKNRYKSRKYYKVIQEAKPYVFSFYARSDKPCALDFKAWHLKWAIMSHRKFRVGKQWKRYEVTISPQLKIRGLELAFEKSGDSNVWIDAVQLNEGLKALAYTPAKAFYAALQSTGEPGETYIIGDQPVGMKLNMRNNTSAPLSLSVKADVEFYTGRKQAVLTSKIDIPAKSNKEIAFKAAPKRMRGYYVCRAVCESAKNGKTTSRLPFVVVDKPLEYGEKSFFGLHPFGTVPLEAQKRIGMCYVRNFRMWKYLKKKNSKFVINDSLWKPFVDRNMILMECMKVTLAPPDAFDNDGRLKNIEDFLEFCRAHIDKYGKFIKYWEIENEPDLVFPKQLKTNSREKAARYYAEVVNRAADMIRRERPGAVILAGGVSGVDFSGGFSFLKEFLKHASKSVDIIPVHPYANARHIGPEASDIGPDINQMTKKLKDLRAIIDSCGGKQDIWVGELGWSLDVFEDFMSQSAMRHAAYLMRSMLLAKSAGVKKVMYFLSEGCIERDKYAYGLWRDGKPLPATGVYSAAAQLLEGSHAGPEIIDGDIQAFAYTGRNGKPFAAIWLQHGEAISAVFDIDAETVEIRDMFNNLMIPEVMNGKIKLKVRGFPLFIMSKKLSMSELCKKVKEADFLCSPAEISIRPLTADSFICKVKNKLPRNLHGVLNVDIKGMKISNPESVIDVPSGSEKEVTFKMAGGTLQNKMITAVLSQNGKVSASADKLIEMVTIPRLEGNGKQVKPSIVLKTRTALMPSDPGIGWNGPEDLSVFADTAWDREYLYLRIKVRDDIHSQNYFPGRLWAGDSVQLAIDTKADGAKGVYKFDRNDYEMSFGLTKKGKDVEVNFMFERGRMKKVVDSINLEIGRKKDITNYSIAIPWRQLGLSPKPGMVIGMNFIVNDDDGAGRNYWLGVTPGIGEMKYPYAYKKFILE